MGRRHLCAAGGEGAKSLGAGDRGAHRGLHSDGKKGQKTDLGGGESVELKFITREQLTMERTPLPFHSVCT